MDPDRQPRRTTAARRTRALKPEAVGTPRRPTGASAPTERDTPHAPSRADTIADARPRPRRNIRGAALERSTVTFSSHRSSGTRREAPPALNPSSNMQSRRAASQRGGQFRDSGRDHGESHDGQPQVPAPTGA